MKTTISIIIPNLDGADLLPECLGSLASQGVTSELIVVDNASSDASVDIVQEICPDALIISNDHNAGFAGAVSQGAHASSGDLLLFLNTDVVMPPLVLAELLAIMNGNPDVGACQPTLLTPEGQLDSAGSLFTKTGFLHHLTETDLLGEPEVGERFALKGACLLVRREAYVEAGGFDPSYFAYFEETDLCWRMRLTGWKLLHVGTVSVTHGVGKTTTRFFSSHYIDYLSFRNRITTIRKNTNPHLRLRVLIPHVVLCVGIAMAFLVRKRPRNTAAIFKALAWHVRNGAEVKASRVVVSGLRTEGDHSIDSVSIAMSFRYAKSLLRTYLVRW